MTRSAKISLCLTTLAVVLPNFNAVAQNPGNAVGGLQIAQVSGTLQAMALDKIKIAAEDKTEYFAIVTEQTSLQYKGTAEPDFLMQGLLVRFSAELNQSGLAQTPVTELEVFTLSQQRRMTPEQIREQTAGVYQVGGEAGNAKKPGDKPADKLGSKGPPKGVQAYRVVGQVVGVQAGKVFVQAGAVRVQMELDPKAVIKVTSRDMTFCQVGDQVKVSGLRTAGQEQLIQSESLEIVGAKPLGPAEAKTSKNAKANKASKGKAAKAGAEKDAVADDKKTDPKKATPKK